MVRLEYSWRFADDLASVTSEEVEAHVMRCLDALESFPEIGSPLVPDRIEREIGPGVRKIVVAPFDLVYTYRSGADVVQVEALVPQRAAW